MFRGRGIAVDVSIQVEWSVVSRGVPFVTVCGKSVSGVVFRGVGRTGAAVGDVCVGGSDSASERRQEWIVESSRNTVSCLE